MRAAPSIRFDNLNNHASLIGNLAKPSDGELGSVPKRRDLILEPMLGTQGLYVGLDLRGWQKTILW